MMGTPRSGRPTHVTAVRTPRSKVGACANPATRQLALATPVWLSEGPHAPHRIRTGFAEAEEGAGLRRMWRLCQRAGLICAITDLTVPVSPNHPPKSPKEEGEKVAHS